MHPVSIDLIWKRSVVPFVIALGMAVIFAASPVAFAQDSGDDESVASLYDNFIHYASIGKFELAKGYADKLLAMDDIDSIELLKAAEKNRNSVNTIQMLIQHSSLSETALKVLKEIRKGEFEQRKDPSRIKQNIQKLLGDPQTEYNAIQRLKESGEYAIPWMVSALGDETQKNVWPRLIQALPQIGKPAVNPLVIALDTPEPEIVGPLAIALGEIGYRQAIPYLQKTLNREDLTDEARNQIQAALNHIASRTGQPVQGNAADNFLALANQYYNQVESVTADPRDDLANLWYYQDGFDTALPVLRDIYGPIMSMRCCEEVLRLEPERKEAIALWLAANMRREAVLGMDTESAEADPDKAAKDANSPEGFPRSRYFTRLAGPLYCQMALERAIVDKDTEVALGAIASLRDTAGETSLIGTGDQQPLVRALQFPDRLVRIKAALALAAALPKTPFAGSEWVTQVLSESLSETGGDGFVVIDPDDKNLNRVLDELRSSGATAIGSATYAEAIERARKELGRVSCFFVSTDVGGSVPAVVKNIRNDVLFALSPVVILEKGSTSLDVEEMLKADDTLLMIPAGSEKDALAEAAAKVFEKCGQQPLDEALSLELALQTAGVLREVAVDGRTVYNVSACEKALITALERDNEELRIRIASVLATLNSEAAQSAIAALALNGSNSLELRVAAFSALAESARKQGNLLPRGTVDKIIAIADEEPDLTLRTAAGQALGALNLKNDQASEIIRKYYKG